MSGIVKRACMILQFCSLTYTCVIKNPENAAIIRGSSFIMKMRLSYAGLPTCDGKKNVLVGFLGREISIYFRICLLNIMKYTV